MKHALQCLARLIRVLLGPTAVADEKLAYGKSLDVLGVSMMLLGPASVCDGFPGMTGGHKDVTAWLQVQAQRMQGA